MIETEYLHNVLDRSKFRPAVKAARKALKDVDFDAIAVSGVSGVSFGTVLAYLMNKRLLIVRKESDNSHSYRTIEGDTKAKRFIFVDDVVSSGRTESFVVRRIYGVGGVTYCGTYLYGDGIDGPNGEGPSWQPAPITRVPAKRYCKEHSSAGGYQEIAPGLRYRTMSSRIWPWPRGHSEDTAASPKLTADAIIQATRTELFHD